MIDDRSDMPMESAPLSPEGAARRDAMLDDLRGVVIRTRRVRKARRVALIATAPALVLAGALFIILQPGATVGPMPAPEQPIVATDKATERELPRSGVIEVIASNTATQGLVQRTSAPARRIERIDDDQLVRMLAEMDRPSGLIRTESEVRLTAAVTDAERERLNNGSI